MAARSSHNGHTAFLTLPCVTHYNQTIINNKRIITIGSVQIYITISVGIRIDLKQNNNNSDNQQFVLIKILWCTLLLL